MPTASERMLSLSSLSSGAEAGAHFLSIVQNIGSGTVYGEMVVELMPDIEVVIENEIEVSLEKEIVVSLEKEITVEVC